MIKLFKYRGFYLLLDFTIIDRSQCLLGLNYNEGNTMKCTDLTMSDCKTFEYAEVQLGLVILNICFGEEKEIDATKYN